MLQIVRTFVYVFFLFFLFAVIVFSVDKYNYREIVRIVLVYLDTMSNSFNDEFALNDPNGLKSAYFYFFRTGFKECLFIISFLLFFFMFSSHWWGYISRSNEFIRFFCFIKFYQIERTITKKFVQKYVFRVVNIWQLNWASQFLKFLDFLSKLGLVFVRKITELGPSKS